MGIVSSALPMVGEFLQEALSCLFFSIIAGMVYGSTDLYFAVALGLAAAILVTAEKAHLNPVISIAVSLCDATFGWANLFIRILAQFLGHILGGLFAVDGLRDQVLDFGVHFTATKTLIFELIFTAMLVIVVLRTRSGVLGGFLHGLTYLVAIIAGGPVYIGQCLLNPALAIGLMIGSASFNSTATDEGNLWFFLAGPFIGALLGVVFYQLTSSMTGDDGNETESSSEDTTEPVKRISTTVTQMVNTGRPVPPRPNPGYGQPQPPYRGNQY